jgi:hypothetical protein
VKRCWPWLLLTPGHHTCLDFCLSVWCLNFFFVLILIYICTQFLTTWKYTMMVTWLHLNLFLAHGDMLGKILYSSKLCFYSTIK